MCVLNGKLRATLTRRLNAGAAPPAEVAVRESPDPGDDGAAGRVQGEHHGDSPAVKVENVADNGRQREVEGGDHRLLLRLDHRGQQPPVEPGGPGPRPPPRPGGPCRPAPAPVTQGLGQGRGPRRRARPIRGPPLATEAATSSSTRPQPGHCDLVLVHRRGDDARAAPSRRQGRVEGRQAATGQSRWPLADANPRRPDRELADRPRHAGTASATGFGRPTGVIGRPCTDRGETEP
jgi:hypothetical protein